jgi:hypothetical protein
MEIILAYSSRLALLWLTLSSSQVLSLTPSSWVVALYMTYSIPLDSAQEDFSYAIGTL